MNQVDAIYRQGVFEPLQPIADLIEEQRVRLSIDTGSANAPRAWLEHIRQLQAVVVQRQGYLPVSTADIASDRLG